MTSNSQFVLDLTKLLVKQGTINVSMAGMLMEIANGSTPNSGEIGDLLAEVDGMMTQLSEFVGDFVRDIDWDEDR